MIESVIRARIEPDLKDEATKVLQSMGLTPSAAIRIFLQQVVAEKALPFTVKVPNAETRAAMKDADEKRSLTRHKSLEALWGDLDSDDEQCAK
jgi:DNA-damage-inducible protein J